MPDLQEKHSHQFPIGKANTREILNAIFRKILPKNGYAVREEQIALASHILDTIERRGVTLAEAETGTGKTEAYLIPAIIDKNMQHADHVHMPIVIATSSIALQQAILTKYIPELSQILLNSDIIQEPLTAVLRKGKAHYLCQRNWRARLPFENNPATHRIWEGLLRPDSSMDLAETDINYQIK
jgi:ATP-dependent DNA helicase DinG